MSYQPPFSITPAILQSVADICQLLGRWSVVGDTALSPHLRRNNRIRTIQASLAIENNTLSLEQVTAVIEGKRVLGLPREIQEVRNAFAAYESLADWRANKTDDLLAAHGMLMAGLADDAGAFRAGGVGIYRGRELVHMAPPPSRVPDLVADLLAWVARAEVHPLIASSVFHYEFEFIHPFSDGNGRMGRLWQTLILSEWQALLAYLPVETVIRDRQADYYRVLGEADAAADATPFVGFMLQALLAAMREAMAQTGSEKSSEKSSEKILACLRQTPSLSARDIALKLNMSPRAVEKQLAALKKSARLRRVGAAKGGHWEVL
ncbi:MAG: Fic family protein [Sulfurimicrobium sp.]|nr:Fic family protein [Sulfurimicrobium sp.]